MRVLAILILIGWPSRFGSYEPTSARFRCTAGGDIIIFDFQADRKDAGQRAFVSDALISSVDSRRMPGGPPAAARPESLRLA